MSKSDLIEFAKDAIDAVLMVIYALLVAAIIIVIVALSVRLVCAM